MFVQLSVAESTACTLYSFEAHSIKNTVEHSIKNTRARSSLKKTRNQYNLKVAIY